MTRLLTRIGLEIGVALQTLDTLFRMIVYRLVCSPLFVLEQVLIQRVRVRTVPPKPITCGFIAQCPSYNLQRFLNRSKFSIFFVQKLQCAIQFLTGL